jgi:hypothetical protein
MSAREILKNLKRGETLFPIFLLVVVSIFFVDSMKSLPRPMFLPRMVQGFVLVMLTIQVVKCLLAKPTEDTRTDSEKTSARRESVKMLITFIGMVLIPIFAWLIGFLLTGCIYVLLTILYWGGSRKRDIIISEIIVIALIWGVFQNILMIDFPVGILLKGLFPA